MLDTALAFLDRGYCPIPQLAGAKRPCVRWKPYQDVQPGRDRVRHWFEELFVGAGIALVLGPAFDLFVIDVDGEDAHRVLTEHLSSLPRAPMVLSGSNRPDKFHLYFQHPAVETRARFTPWHPQLEFRGHRGIVVAPPSLHPSGGQYRWAEGLSLDDVAPPPVPEAILLALEQNAEARARPARISRSRTGRAPAGAPSGRDAAGSNLSRTGRWDRINGLAEISRATREFLLGRVANGPDWNGRLFRAATDLCGCGVAIDVAEPLLIAGARPWNDVEDETARRTIRSAYAEPRMPARALASARNARDLRGRRCFQFRIEVPEED